MIESEIDTITDISSFAKDVREGLSLQSKRLSSRYFYDETGDRIFQQIMQLEEYYPTRTELAIFQESKQEILSTFLRSFRIIELGVGDGMKTKVLLRYFLDQKVDFTYSPVDISADILSELKRSLIKEIPDLKVEPLAGDYFEIMGETVEKNEERNVVFFLGSNIGNYNYTTRDDFLRKLRANLKKGDQALIGFDLKKDPLVILNAYNDSRGVTESFNKNLLVRINNELGGDFNPDQFIHYPTYEPDSGECRSYLLSTRDQVVTIDELGKAFEFKKWESIFTEVSKKFDLREIHELAICNGFTVRQTFSDSRNWFVDAIWEAI